MRLDDWLSFFQSVSIGVSSEFHFSRSNFVAPSADRIKTLNC